MAQGLWLVRMQREHDGYVWIESRGVFTDSMENATQQARQGGGGGNYVYMPGTTMVISAVRVPAPVKAIIDGDVPPQGGV